MTRPIEQLAYDAKSIRLQLEGLKNLIDEIEHHSVEVNASFKKLYDSDNDTFMKVHNQINSAYDVVCTVRSSMREFSRNHFDSYLEQQSKVAID
jgi:hypothetical protein